MNKITSPLTLATIKELYLKTLVYILIILILLGCRSDIDKIQGHWHSVGDIGRYETLDIKDSSVILNKLDKHGFALKEKILIKNDTIILPLAYHYSFNFYVSFNEDTLILKDFNTPNWYELHFVKYSSENNKVEHLSSDFNSNLGFSIKLDTLSKSIPFDTIFFNNRRSMINIGYPKEQWIPRLDEDSLYLSWEGYIINYREIKELLDVELEETQYSNEKINSLDYSILIINADKNTPENIFDSIYVAVQNLDYLKNIYRTCVNINEETIGLYKLR